MAQVPNPVRLVHPGIAPKAAGGAVVYGPAPKFQYQDGTWNHGEGFAPGVVPDVDYGGWFGHDDGRGLTSADIHLTCAGWTPYTWTNVLHPASGTRMERLQGYLRPAGAPLPTMHPRYGGPISWVIPGTTTMVSGWVDGGGFELFRPDPTVQGNTYNGEKVLIVISCSATAPFPDAYVGQEGTRPVFKSYYWWNTYTGYFSPDGLTRSEFGSSNLTGIPSQAVPLPGTSAALAHFLANLDPNVVARMEPDAIAVWANHPEPENCYPIVGYSVLPVMHRQTELNEQRHLQVVQAIKCLLQEATSRNPLGSANALTAQEVEDRVVVVFAGGSNGGTQASFTTLRHPDLVHGCFAQVINSGMQRLFGEQDLGWAVAELTGSNLPGATVGPGDFLDWCQYAWQQNVEVHDLSFLRHFFSGSSYRPACFFVGDEDLTSTGTDWIRVADGTAWTPFGIRSSPSSFGDPNYHTFAWMSAENTEHGAGPAVNPYRPGGGTIVTVGDAVLDLAEHARKHRHAQGSQPVPMCAIPHNPRTAGQQFRGLDEPHEWFFGRGATGSLPAPQPGAPLVRDDAFFATAQPGAAGTWLGHEEAMLIQDGRVYVGSAEGIVTSFRVDTLHPRQPLVPVGRSPQLGHRAFAMAVLPGTDGWSLVVGTRRHLYLLDRDSLAILQVATLPWEVAQPHGIKVADVLQGNSGPEVIFRTVHGGLCFYSQSLAPVYEWTEPGIEDFVVRGGEVTILSSRRAVLASVAFDSQNNPSLIAASQALPLSPSDLPCQGVPQDLELLRINFGPFRVPVFVSSWSGDADGAAIRIHGPGNMLRVPTPGGMVNMDTPTVDIATCREAGAPAGVADVGDHLLVLSAGKLRLFNSVGLLVGVRDLTQTAPFGEYYPFAGQALSLAVGELVPGGTNGYSEQVVIATQTGHLVWMHIGDLATGGATLPLSSAFTAVRTVAGGVGTEVQPHTNQALSATWAIAKHPVDNLLHVCDQNGGYWKVGPTGAIQMFDASGLAVRLKGWAPMGSGLTGVTSSLLNSPWIDFLYQGSPVTTGLSQPWCPNRSKVLPFEVNPPNYVAFNWVPGQAPFGSFHDMLLFQQGGSVVVGASGASKEAFYWTNNVDRHDKAADPWGNLVCGLRITQGGQVDGVWASTGVPQTIVGNNESGDRAGYHNLRNLESGVPAMNCQAALSLSMQGSTVVFLGCPGGRVRAVEPGAWATGLSPHALGSVRSTPDLGFGGAGLAVRQDGLTSATVWFGTLYDPVARPASYSNSAGVLGDSELAVGAVHKVAYSLGQGFGAVQTVRLYPSAPSPRGAYGVVGLLVTDLLAEPGDELIVGTLSGDLIVYSADSLAEIWRTHLNGAIGFTNAMVAADLDNDGKKELYVAGSFGLSKFIQP